MAQTDRQTSRHGDFKTNSAQRGQVGENDKSPLAAVAAAKPNNEGEQKQKMLEAPLIERFGVSC